MRVLHGWRAGPGHWLRVRCTLRLCRSVAEQHPEAEFGQRSAARDTRDLHNVSLHLFVAGVRYPSLQRAVVGQDDQTLRVEVESTRRIDIAMLNVVGEGWSGRNDVAGGTFDTCTGRAAHIRTQRRAVRELAKHAEWFVEQYQPGQVSPRSDW